MRRIKMALEQIADKVVETDVLVVGGGIAGCPAAYKAAEKGLKVTLAEKSKTDRSGSAGQGIDHHSGTFPRGMTPADFLKQVENVPRYTKGGQMSTWGTIDPNIQYKLHAARDWSIEELEKMGVPMRWDDGEFMVIDVAFHGGWPVLHVHWQNVKPIMAAAVRKKGVNVLERTMVLDLLTNNGQVVGATAINTRTGEFVVIKAKATILATAKCSRVYEPETPQPWKYKFNYHWCPASVSGDGWAMAYRAGAELASLEQSGGGYRFRDDKMMSYGNVRGWGIESKTTTWDGEEANSATMSDTERAVRFDPTYRTLEHLPDDFMKRIEVAFVDERMVSFKISEDRGFDFRSHWFESMDIRPNQLHAPCGVCVDSDFQSRLKGLYAIGDTIYGIHNVALCAANGFIIGDSIPAFIGEAGEPVVDEAQVENQKQAALASLAVKDGQDPIELEMAIRYICNRYVGLDKAEGRLREGLRRLGTLRRVFLPKLMAKNPHEQMRALEVRNLMDIAELHIQASLERKETRRSHTRVDYPEPDPALEDMILHQRLENGKPVIEFRKLPELDMNLKPDSKW